MILFLLLQKKIRYQCDLITDFLEYFLERHYSFIRSRYLSGLIMPRIAARLTMEVIMIAEFKI